MGLIRQCFFYTIQVCGIKKGKVPPAMPIYGMWQPYLGIPMIGAHQIAFFLHNPSLYDKKGKVPPVMSIYGRWLPYLGILSKLH